MSERELADAFEKSLWMAQKEIKLLRDLLGRIYGYAEANRYKDIDAMTLQQMIDETLDEASKISA